MARLITILAAVRASDVIGAVLVFVGPLGLLIIGATVQP